MDTVCRHVCRQSSFGFFHRAKGPENAARAGPRNTGEALARIGALELWHLMVKFNPRQKGGFRRRLPTAALRDVSCVTLSRISSREEVH